MNGVNELFQNIRFLKFYGWGRFVRILKFRTNKKTSPENHWANGVRNRRDTELKWRIRENILGTLISFIWFITLTTLQIQ